MKRGLGSHAATLASRPAWLRPAVCAALLASCHGDAKPPGDTDAGDSDVVVDTDLPADDTDGPLQPRCGDGVRGDDELCDDGNLDDADDCTRACEPTAPPEASALVDVNGAVDCDPDAAIPVDPSWAGVTAHVSGVALLESGAEDTPLTLASLRFTSGDRTPVDVTTDASSGSFDVDLDVCTAWTATLNRDDVWPSVRHFLTFLDDTQTLRLRAPGPTELGAIADLAGAPLSDAAGVVAGHATDCAGVGLADVLVVLRAEDGATRLDLPVVYLDSDSGGRTTTPADGAYVIPNVPVGTVWVETWARRDGQVALRARAKVHVTAGQIDWVDLAWGRLDGTLQDARCAAPRALRVF